MKSPFKSDTWLSCQVRTSVDLLAGRHVGVADFNPLLVFVDAGLVEAKLALDTVCEARMLIGDGGH
jgi:hypothetical protein